MAEMYINTLKGCLKLDNKTLKGNLKLPERVSTSNYEELYNKPSINGVTLINDKSFEDLGDRNLTNMEILNIFNQVFKGGE